MMQPPLSPAQRPAASRSLARVPSLTSLYVQALTPRVDTVTRLASRLRRDAPHATVEHRSLPEVTYVVDGVRGDPVELARYCTVVGAARSEVMPAGYVHVLAFPVAMALMVSAQFPLPVAGMVHVANSVEVARPVLVGETLTVAAWARNLAEHAKGTQVDLVTEVSVQGEVVWRGVSTYLAKGTFLRGRGEVRTPDPFVPPFPTGSWSLPASLGRDYAAVSGDRNPIHLSALTAKPFGFPSAIAHGMYTSARALAEADPLVGDRFRWTVTFAKPVLLPGRVSVAITPHGEGRQGAEYVGWNPKNGTVHFRGDITALDE